MLGNWGLQRGGEGTGRSKELMLGLGSAGPPACRLHRGAVPAGAQQAPASDLYLRAWLAAPPRGGHWQQTRPSLLGSQAATVPWPATSGPANDTLRPVLQRIFPLPSSVPLSLFSLSLLSHTIPPFLPPHSASFSPSLLLTSFYLPSFLLHPATLSASLLFLLFSHIFFPLSASECVSILCRARSSPSLPALSEFASSFLLRLSPLTSSPSFFLSLSVSLSRYHFLCVLSPSLCPVFFSTHPLNLCPSPGQDETLHQKLLFCVF